MPLVNIHNFFALSHFSSFTNIVAVSENQMLKAELRSYKIAFEKSAEKSSDFLVNKNEFVKI
jgi:hypothetical protein